MAGLLVKLRMEERDCGKQRNVALGSGTFMDCEKWKFEQRENGRTPENHSDFHFETDKLN